MQPNDLNIDAIHPRNGAKFSPNLHEFLSCRRERLAVRYARVYIDKDGVLWLGYLDEGYLIGARLMQILCNGRKTETFAFGNLGRLIEVPEFWQRYMEVGRCAIDTQHQMFFVGDDTRWSVAGDVRKCLWCGNATQRRERYTRRTSHERWVSAGA